MPFQQIFHSDRHYIEVCYYDEVSPELVQQSIEEGWQLANKNNCFLFLVDFSELKPSGSFLTPYDAAKDIKTTSNQVIIKEALIKPKIAQAAEEISFFETTALNRGINAKMFSDRNDALNWLLA